MKLDITSQEARAILASHDPHLDRVRDYLARRESSVRSVSTSLDGVTEDLDSVGTLHHYAASAAFHVLFENWQMAMADGSSLTDLLKDVETVVSILRGTTNGSLSQLAKNFDKENA